MSMKIRKNYPDILDQPHPFTIHRSMSYKHWKRPLTKTYDYNMDVQEYYYKPHVDFLYRKDMKEVTREVPPGAQSFEERCVNYWPGREPRLHIHEDAKDRQNQLSHETDGANTDNTSSGNDTSNTLLGNEDPKVAKSDRPSPDPKEFMAEKARPARRSESNAVYLPTKSASNLEIASRIKTEKNDYMRYMPASTMQNPFSISRSCSGPHWRKPLTKTYDYNMDVQEYYYKPHVDYLHMKDANLTKEKAPPGPQTFAERCVHYWPGMRPRMENNEDAYGLKAASKTANRKDSKNASDESTSSSEAGSSENAETPSKNQPASTNYMRSLSEYAIGKENDRHSSHDNHIQQGKTGIDRKRPGTLPATRNARKAASRRFPNKTDDSDGALDQKIDMLREKLILAKRTIEHIMQRWPTQKRLALRRLS